MVQEWEREREREKIRKWEGDLEAGGGGGILAATAHIGFLGREQLQEPF